MNIYENCKEPCEIEYNFYKNFNNLSKNIY